MDIFADYTINKFTDLFLTQWCFRLTSFVLSSWCTFISDCISQKYSGKVATNCWADIRRAVNQKCNDIRKKNVASSADHLQHKN